MAQKIRITLNLSKVDDLPKEAFYTVKTDQGEEVTYLTFDLIQMAQQDQGGNTHTARLSVRKEDKDGVTWPKYYIGKGKVIEYAGATAQTADASRERKSWGK